MTNRLLSWFRDEGINIRAVCFLAYASGATWYPVFNIYLKQVGLTGTQIGVISAVIPAVMLICQPLWGVFADRWGRRKALVLSMLITALLGLGFLYKSHFWFYFIWMIPFAFFYNPFGPLIDSLSLDYVEHTHKSSYGLMRLWGAIGWSILTFSVGYYIADSSYAPIFPIAAVVMFLAALIGLLGPARTGASGLEVNFKNLKPVLKNRKLVLYLFIMLIVAIGTFPIWTFYSVFLSDLGASSTLIGFAFSLDAIMEIPFYFISALILKKICAGRLLQISFLAYALRLYLYSISTTPHMAVAVEVLQGLSWAAFLVGAVEYVNQIVPGPFRATGQSLFWAFHFGAGAIIGNSLAGYLYDHMPLHQVYRLMAYIMLAVAVTSYFALATGRKTSADEQNEQMDGRASA